MKTIRILIACALALASTWAAAQLTSSQVVALKAACQADATCAPLAATAQDEALAAWFNAVDSAFIVERTSLSRHEILTATSSTGSTFAWAGAGYITRSQGERDAFREMFNSTGSVNPSLPSIKAAFADIFSGAGGAANRAHIAALSKRPATRAEKILATGTGTDASPATMTYQGTLSYADASAIRS